MNTHMNDKKSLIKTVIVVAAAFALYKVLPALGSDNNINNNLVMECELLVCALAAALITKRMGTLRIRREGFKAGIVAGWYFLLMALIKVVQWVGKLVSGTTDISVPAVSIVTFILFCLLIGISEELLFRGVLLEGFLDYYGNRSAQDIRKAVIIAGCLFGMVHLFNIKSSSELAIGLALAVVNMADGILYGAIYIRARRNIWPCIIIHALRDGATYLSGGILCAATSNSIKVVASGASVTQIGGVLVVALCDLVVAMILMQDNKLSDQVCETESATAHAEE